MSRRSSDDDALPDELAGDRAGQTGDTQGLSSIAEAADESVEELADEGQDYEAEAVQGVEEAGDHPEQPVPMHRRDPRPPGPDGH
jgi:hypothetical protein